jgi:DNA polymerase-3 subunit gamma/tau
MIPARELTTHLRRVAEGERVRVSDEALARIARAAEGSVRDALSLFDQVLSFSGEEVRDADLSALLGLIDRELLCVVPQAVIDGDSLATLDLVERLSDYGADYRNFARELLLLFREVLLVKLAPAGGPLLEPILPEERDRLRPFAEAFSEEDLLRFIDVLGELEGELRWAQDPRVSLELALLRLIQTTRLQPFAELVSRVEALASGRVAAETERRRRSAPRARPDRPAAGGASPQTATPPDSGAATASSAETDTPDLLARMLAGAAGRPSLSQALKGGCAELQGDTVTLEVPADFRPLAEMHRDEYQALAREAAGRPVKLQLGTAPTAAGATADQPSAEERRRERLIQQASREPAVQEALELFDGKIVDVKDAGS